MCGRFVSVASTPDLTAEFRAAEVVGEDLPPSWNVAPTDPVRILTARRPRPDRDAAPVRQLHTARWGLLPHWSGSRSPKVTVINARSETVTGKPAFRSAAARRRCLVPALGFYEWTRQGGETVPYFLHPPDGGMLAMAGLYEIWRDDALPDDDPNRTVWTCTIITRPADSLGEIHDRCPVPRSPRAPCAVAGLRGRRPRARRPVDHRDARAAPGPAPGLTRGRQRQEQRPRADHARHGGRARRPAVGAGLAPANGARE
jgi:putative SOS response-associated peptidase YedK